MAGTIQRWKPGAAYARNRHRYAPLLIPYDQGEYVLFADHERVLAERDRVLDEYRKRCVMPSAFCVGYPDCDGNLPGEDHSPECPRFLPIDDDRCATCKAVDALREG